MLVAGSNNQLWREMFPGTMSQCSTGCTVGADRMLQASENAMKLWIADNGNPLNVGTAGAIDVSGNLTKAGQNFAACNAAKADIMCTLLNVTGATVAGSYSITSASSGAAVLSPLPGVGTADFRIERAPKVYDPIADTLTLQVATDAGNTGATGIVPLGCPILCMWHGRMVVAGAPIAPHVWYMSRLGELTNWNYLPGDNDALRAVAGTNASAGNPGLPITALCPLTDDMLIIGCQQAVWAMNGDPASGGSLGNLSHMVGIFGPQSWCIGPSGELIFFSGFGLHKVAANAAFAATYQGVGYVTDLSTKLPRDLLNVDSTYNVQLAYDVCNHGVHIYMTPPNPRNQVHFWFDYASNSFWPVSMQGTQEPCSLLAHISDGLDRSWVILGGRDGYIRRTDWDFTNDDGSLFNSYIYYGPIRLGGDDYHTGLLEELIAALDTASNAVTWSTYTGNTFQEAYQNTTAFATGTWGPSLNYKVRPRMRGPCFYLKVSSTGAAGPWAMERITAVIKRGGIHRL